MTNCYRAKGDFFSRTRKRVIKETVFFLIVFILLFSGLFNWMNLEVKIAILSAIILFILIGIAYYPKAKIIAENYKVFTFDSNLGVQVADKLLQIPYKDLKIVNVTKHNNDVIEIKLKTAFNQTIKLEGLENMNQLYVFLVTKVEEA